jgi:hypothetical protein
MGDVLPDVCVHVAQRSDHEAAVLARLEQLLFAKFEPEEAKTRA